MMPPQVDPGEGKHKHSCDLMIYDEESDKHVIITWEDALRATCLYAPDGKTTDATDVRLGSSSVKDEGVNGGGTMLEWYKDAYSVNVYNTQSAATNWSALSAEQKKIRIVLARPFSAPLSPSLLPRRSPAALTRGAHPRRVSSSQSST